MIKNKSGQKFKYLKNKRAVSMKEKVFFIIFKEIFIEAKK